MTNEVTPYEPEDDGFHGSLKRRLLQGTFLKWNDTLHWRDRDGLAPPSPLVVIAINELLQKWKDGKAETITEKPLPDVETLNAAIPQAEWEIGLDGKRGAPWKHTIVVYFVNLATGELFTYMAATIGAHIAFDGLKEAVITMRALRGMRVMPIVNLAERPMKTKFGMSTRPHFEIIGWKIPGGDARAVPMRPAAPQLSGPTAASVETPPAPSVAPPAAPSATPPSPTSNSAPPYQAKPKPSVNLAGETLAAMSDVKPLTSNEILNDEIPF
jgi:hypothetical protein